MKFRSTLLQTNIKHFNDYLLYEIWWNMIYFGIILAFLLFHDDRNLTPILLERSLSRWISYSRIGQNDTFRDSKYDANIHAR